MISNITLKLYMKFTINTLFMLFYNTFIMFILSVVTNLYIFVYIANVLTSSIMLISILSLIIIFIHDVSNRKNKKKGNN